VTICKAGLQE